MVPLQIIAFAAEKQEFSSGDEIVTQGKKARAAFVILSGQAKIKNEGQEVAVAEPGTFLGEVAMLGSGNYTITATASGPVETARITHELFLRVVKEYPEFGRQVLQNLGDRLGSHLLELEGIRAMLNKSRSFSDLR